MGYLIACVAIVLAYRVGWDNAHLTVAKECEQLGGFYVGKRIYKCTAIERGE